ncbi:MAG: prepilin-type N-terminal cleavage/methylation domain-containing protein [Deltaproteobacteria bacterium]|nr:prepilin-type N-terminal cleavage/methylation domain-containing protein [Deltaproteobacteria bacterium]
MRSRGFTLLEIMVALALLGLGLVVLIKSAANNIRASEESHMMGIATDLARGKMYDIEETLLKDGFTDTDQSQSDPKPFDTEGWPNIYYSYKVDQVEMPDFDQLTAMAQGRRGSGAFSGTGSNNYYGSAFAGAYGSGFGSDVLGGFQNSALGGMLGMFGGGSGPSSGVAGGMAGAVIQSQYTMFQQILKVSVRKVTLTVTWTVMGSQNSMKVVCFFTDPAAMDKVLMGMGATEQAQGSGAGSGSGGPPARGSGATR